MQCIIYEFYFSIENGNSLENSIYDDLQLHCQSDQVDRFGNKCQMFNSSEKAFRWILSSHEKYVESRYGGITINADRPAVWYNNKGYHSMPVYLNQLNTAILRSAMNNSDYSIFTNNYPLKLGDKELTTSSM